MTLDANEKLIAALEAARARGAKRTDELAEDPEMLLPAEMAERLGISVLDLVAMKTRKEILAVGLTGHGMRYPSWQLGKDGRPLPGLAWVLDAFDHNEFWRAWRFLLSCDRQPLRDLEAGHGGAVAANARGWQQGHWI